MDRVIAGIVRGTGILLFGACIVVGALAAFHGRPVVPCLGGGEPAGGDGPSEGSVRR